MKQALHIHIGAVSSSWLTFDLLAWCLHCVYISKVQLLILYALNEIIQAVPTVDVSLFVSHVVLASQ